MTSHPGANSPPSADDDDGETFQESLLALKRLGFVVDSGRRKWTEQTGRYEILWKASPTCKGGYETKDCLCSNLPVESLTSECPARLPR
jgi:hypothetical protein